MCLYPNDAHADPSEQIARKIQSGHAVNFSVLQSAIQTTQSQFQFQQGNVRLNPVFGDLTTVVRRLYEAGRLDASLKQLDSQEDSFDQKVRSAIAQANQFMRDEKVGAAIKTRLSGTLNKGKNAAERARRQFGTVRTLLELLKQKSRLGRVSLPEGFLDAFSTASAEQRPGIVQKYFNVKVVTAHGRRNADRTKTVTFKPDNPPQMNRLYFFVGTSEILHLLGEKFRPVNLVYNLVTKEDRKMPLRQFASQIKSGIWLLESKSSRAELRPVIPPIDAVAVRQPSRGTEDGT